MKKVLNFLRIPLTVLGLALMFIAERYLGAESYHTALRIAAVVLAVLGVVSTFALSSSAAARGLSGEASSWRYAALWQLAVAMGLGIYLWYAKTLGASPIPETPFAKVLLGGWLLFLGLGIFSGIGLEWSMRDNGFGHNAEPLRVARAGLSMLGIGMLAGALSGINYAGDKKDVSKDLSYLKVRTPTESTLKMVGALDKDITIALFFPMGNEVKGLVTDYFEALAKKQGHVKLAFYDKDMHPTKAEEYRVSRNGQIVMDMDGKKSKIEIGTTLTKARKALKELDQEFQKSFLEITADRLTLYFTRGHGEMSWLGEGAESPFRSLKAIEAFLRRQNYSTRVFGVGEGSATAVPDDAAAVIIAGPTEPFLPEEIQVLKAYIERGGNVMVFTDIQGADGQLIGDTSRPNPLYDMMAEMGIKFHQEPLANDKNFVTMTRSDADHWFIFSNIFTSHESVITLARNEERVAVLIYQGGYLSVTAETPKWRSFETVRVLSDTYNDTNRNYKLDGNEKQDAYVVGAVSEYKDAKSSPVSKGKKGGRVVAFADASAISDLVAINNQGNALFFVDSLKWLVGESESAGEIATEEDIKIRHTSKEDAVWFHSTVVVVPLLVLGAGFVATRRRKEGAKETNDAA
jgi:hypothetical protein